MDSRERVIRTLEFRGPDKLPLDLWTLPATFLKYGRDLEEILANNERDIVQFDAPLDVSHNPRSYEVGSFIDEWGSGWHVLQQGMIGEVNKPVLKALEEISSYVPPIAEFKARWEEYKPELEKKIREARSQGKFILGGWSNPFERMQFLRGTENLYCDLGLQEPEVSRLRDIVFGYYKEYVNAWLEMDIDGTVFGDDWGSQRALLISPKMWRSFFKPAYKELFDMVKAKGKHVFMHSDGYIMDIYEDLIELGVEAVNSQLWCMNIEQIAAKYAGRITFWGEISRQDTLPNGTPEDIRQAAAKMKKYLFVNGGGLIGQSEVGKDVPLENIEAVLSCWQDTK